jgi:nitric oxide reductase subunit B
MLSFWVLSSGVVFMTVSLTFAGVLQTHLERVMGMSYMDAQDQLGLFYIMRLGAGVVTVFGALLFIYSLLVPRSAEAIARNGSAPVAAERWSPK